jgi:hypothetical protein
MSYKSHKTCGYFLIFISNLAVHVMLFHKLLVKLHAVVLNKNYGNRKIPQIYIKLLNSAQNTFIRDQSVGQLEDKGG